MNYIVRISLGESLLTRSAWDVPYRDVSLDHITTVAADFVRELLLEKESTQKFSVEVFTCIGECEFEREHSFPFDDCPEPQLAPAERIWAVNMWAEGAHEDNRINLDEFLSR